MKGIHLQPNGHWRVNIMVNRERMTKTCKTFEQAVVMAHNIRHYLNLKHLARSEKGQSVMQIIKDQNTGNFSIGNDDDNQNPTTTTKALVPQTFTFPATGQGVRIIAQGDDGQPWFVAGDVCSLLGTDPKDVPAILEADEHCVLYTIEGRNNSSGLRKDTRMISESGMYGLVLRSRKPEARAFSKWVRSEVLPSIRRTGGYIIAQPEETPEIIMARALFVAKDSIDRLNSQLEAAQPKLRTYDTLLNADHLYTITEAAKHFQMSAQKLNFVLTSENWLFKKSVDKLGNDIPTVNLPRQCIIDRGYAVVKSRKPANGNGVFSQTYITAKGLIAVERLLNRRLEG